MMKQKTWFMIGVLILCLSFVGCAAGANGDDPYVFSIRTSRMSPMDTLEKLNRRASFIFEGVCLASEPVFQDNALYTLSEVEITAVYKGGLHAGDIVQIVEMGGRTTAGSYQRGCHAAPDAAAANREQLPDDYPVAQGADGFYPLKAGETVLLFAVDSTGFLKEIQGSVYAIVGDYEGKLFPQGDGAYRRPLPGDTDTLKFGDEALTITPEELNGVRAV